MQAERLANGQVRALVVLEERRLRERVLDPLHAAEPVVEELRAARDEVPARVLREVLCSETTGLGVVPEVRVDPPLADYPAPDLEQSSLDSLKQGGFSRP